LTGHEIGETPGKDYVEQKNKLPRTARNHQRLRKIEMTLPGGGKGKGAVPRIVILGGVEPFG